MQISGVGVPYDASVKTEKIANGAVINEKLSNDFHKNVPFGIAGLDGNGYVNVANLPITGMNYQGLWDADTNTPTLQDGTGNAGDYFRCSVDGTQDLGSGNITFTVGDVVIYNQSDIWQRVPAASGVVSVNGKNGIVEIKTSDIGFSGVIVYLGSDASFPGGGRQAIAWSGETVDTDNYWTTGIVLTVPSAGLYRLSMGANVSGSGSIRPSIGYDVNTFTVSITLLNGLGAVADFPVTLNGSKIVQLNAGDIIRFFVDCPGSTGFTVLGGNSTFASIQYLGA